MSPFENYSTGIIPIEMSINGIGVPMPLIDITTAAGRLGVSPQYARRLVRSRPDIGRRIGGRWRVIDGDAFAQLCTIRESRTKP